MRVMNFAITESQRNLAREVFSWVPVPYYIKPDNGPQEPGPGVTLLKKYGLVTYETLRRTCNGEPISVTTMGNIIALKSLMERDGLAIVQKQPKPTASATPLANQFPDVADLTEKVEALQALVVNIGQTNLELKGMVEKLMKELGVK